MIESGRYPLAQINHLLPVSVDAFFCCASYESRCLSIATVVDPSRFRAVGIFQNEEFPTASQPHVRSMERHFGATAKVLRTSTSSPLRTADVVQSFVTDYKLTSSSVIAIDITTFTHEQLLILVAVLRTVGLTNNLITLYTGASQYMTGESKWLSRGVRDIRSVLGYPGVLSPSQNIHLIVLIGFELERARRLIEAYEPTVVSLGYSDPSNSISLEHSDKNRSFHAQLAHMLGNVHEFCFSGKSAQTTKSALLDCLRDDYANVIAPLNTKISTLGAALAAFERPEVQLCYAQAEDYNVEGYSEPSDSFYVVDYYEGAPG